MPRGFDGPVMSKDGYYVGQPIAGNGEFGPKSLIDVSYNQRHELCLRVIRPLNYEEQCRLCDAHAKNFFGLFIHTVSAKNGTDCAMLFYKAGGPGYAGKIPKYPNKEKCVGGGGSLV